MRPIFILVLFQSVLYSSNAQYKPEVALEQFDKHFPVEKIFIQYAKTEYIAGEVIWFNSYVFSNASLTNFSTNLYVELYDQQKQLIDKLIVPLDNGVGHGSLSLKENTPEGVYYIRAYTKWSLYFGNPLPYLQPLVVYNPNSKNRLVEKEVRWTAYAYPESGSLMEGVLNKVAVRLFSKTRLPENWTAYVTEKINGGAPIVISKSLNSEIGSFQFLPKSSSNYQVKIIDNYGNEQIIPLPQAKKSGIAFQVQNFPNSVRCILSFKGLSLKNASYTIIGQMYHQMVYKAIVKPKDSVVIVNIPTEMLTNGILHLSLFNSNNEVVAERLAFVLKNDMTTLQLRSDSFSLQERKSNMLSFKADSLLASTITVLITDSEASTQKETLLSSLWLSNDITTSPHYPAYFFKDTHANRLDALDALMISERWRWFNWTELMNKPFKPAPYQGDDYLSFTGTVFLNKRIQLNKTLNLFIKKDSSFVFTQARTDSTGSFTLQGVRFNDTAQLYYQLASRRKDAQLINTYVEANHTFDRFKGTIPESPYHLVQRRIGDSVSSHLLAKMQDFENWKAVDRRYKQLEEVIVKAKKKSAKEKLNERLSSSMFQSFNERIYDLTDPRENTGGMMDIIEWSRSRVTGLSSFPFYRGSLISVYVDEVLTDIFSARIPLTDVALVKFLPNPSGTLASNSALLIYTKRGDQQGFLTGLPSTKLVGYRSIIPFHNVDYSNDWYKAWSLDTRDVLYWKTDVQSDSIGNVPIRFYNNDRSKSLRVLIMGFDQMKMPVYHEAVLTSQHP